MKKEYIILTKGIRKKAKLTHLVKTVKSKKKEDNILPFEQREELKSLSLLVTIVNRNQSNYFTEAYKNKGAAISTVLFAHSLPPEEIITILAGESNLRKDMILTIIKTEEIDNYIKIASDRFKISKASKGIAFTIPLDSVSGIVIYKFLSDHNKEERTYGK